MEYITLVLQALGGGAIIVIALSKWLGDVWSQRIIEGVKADNAKEITALKHELNIKYEEAKWPMSREDALAGEFRSAIENVVLPLMSAIHSICWLTWTIVEFPEELTEKKLDDYDEEAHLLLPRISGYLALVAAYDKECFNELREIVRDLYKLDSDVGTFSHALLKARDTEKTNDIEKYQTRLRKCHDRGVAMEDDVPFAVANLVNERISHRANQVLKSEKS